MSTADMTEKMNIESTARCGFVVSVVVATLLFSSLGYADDTRQMGPLAARGWHGVFWTLTFAASEQKIDVRAVGDNLTTLKMSYPRLMQTVVSAVTHADAFIDNTRSLGFTQILFDDTDGMTYMHPLYPSGIAGDLQPAQKAEIAVRMFEAKAFTPALRKRYKNLRSTAVGNDMTTFRISGPLSGIKFVREFLIEEEYIARLKDMGFKEIMFTNSATGFSHTHRL